jgi:hypothetical protein
MSMNRIALTLASISLFAFSAHAQLAIEPHAENGVTFVSGGVGGEGVSQIREVEKEYNLHLLFAVQGSGDYLSRVYVKILDGNGRVLVDTMSEGPYFLAKLNPGKYDVVAESAGKTIDRRVDISPGHAISESLYWPAVE